MSEKKQNLNFNTPNKDQQKIFQDYLGKKLGTKALLVLEHLDNKTKEFNYTFVYQYPERLVLASFELTLDKENKLKSFGSNLLIDGANSYKINIEDLILDYVKKSIEDTDVEEIRLESSLSAIKFDELLINDNHVVIGAAIEGEDEREDVVEDYSTKSQAMFSFVCGDVSFGSFCCVLKKNEEFFILTAKHNLKKAEDNYDLIDENENTIRVTLIENIEDYDAAILQINENDYTKISEYINFNGKYFDKKDSAKNVDGFIVGRKNIPNTVEAFVQDTNFITETKAGYKITNRGIPSISGGCVFSTNRTLLGIYIAENANKNYSYVLPIYKIIDKLNGYEIV